jgi:hypothetical protein
MSLKWTVSHRLRLVVAVAHGEIEALEMMEYLSSIDRHEAQAYKKLLDLSELEPSEEAAVLGRLIREQPAPAGPVAVVVAGNKDLYQKAKAFVDTTGPLPLIRVFHQQHVAQLWLDRLDGTLH